VDTRERDESRGRGGSYATCARFVAVKTEVFGLFLHKSQALDLLLQLAVMRFHELRKRGHMRRSTISLACLMAVVLIIWTSSPEVFAQQAASGNWSNLQSTEIDQELSIKLKTGKTVRGKFSSANDSELTIIRKGKQEVIAKDGIAQIFQLERKAEKGKYAAIGAGIGAGVGLGVGAAKNSPHVDDGEIYPVMGTILGAGIGAVGGLLFGQAKRKHLLIYQSP